MCKCKRNNQAMPYLIDGHNLIPKVPGLSLKAMDDEIQLIQRLQDFCRQTGKNVEVYFDKAPPGQAGRQSYGRVKAYYIRAGRTADEAIIARLRGMGRAAKNWRVVSSDRQVAAAARSFQAEVISSDAFARSLLMVESEDRPDPGVDEDPSLDPTEIKAWLDLFNSGGDDLRHDSGEL
jgi:predicted RNA-binding protein with PIN domain